MGELVSSEVDTIDGYVLTERTITADRIVAHTIIWLRKRAVATQAGKQNLPRIFEFRFFSDKTQSQ